MNKYKAIMAGVALLAVPALCSAGVIFQQDFEGYALGTPGSNTVIWAYSGPGANQTNINSIISYNGSQAYSYHEDASGEVGTDWYWYGGLGAGIASPGALVGTTPADLTASVDVALVGATAPIDIKFSQYNASVNSNTWEAVYTGTMATDGSVTTMNFALNTGTELGTWDSTLGLDFSSGYGPTQFGNDDGNQVIIDNLTVSVIPEPATLGLIGFAGVGVLFVRRRFKI